MPWIGWPNWSPTYPTKASRWYGIMDTTRTIRVACAKKTGMDDLVPALIDAETSPKEFRKSWARLIQKIYQVDPLLCPKCQGAMKVIGFIKDDAVIEKILRCPGL